VSVDASRAPLMQSGASTGGRVRGREFEPPYGFRSRTRTKARETLPGVSWGPGATPSRPVPLDQCQVGGNRPGRSPEESLDGRISEGCAGPAVAPRSGQALARTPGPTGALSSTRQH
jgi:hypothetical protein